MQDLILTVGHNVDGHPVHTTASVCTACDDVLGIPGYTAIPCAGMWMGQREESTRLEICALQDDEAERLAGLVPRLAALLGQAEIMAEIRPSRARFIKAEDEQRKEA